MKIGIATSHLYSIGGGYQAVKWHILAFKALGHEVTVFTRNTPSEGILRNWFDGVALRQYTPHCERGFDFFLNIDHFTQSLPEAKNNAAHVFFPMRNTPIPHEGVKLYSNSAYTARHIKHQWEREAAPLYIPIDSHFSSGDKEKIILHVSRFSEPSEWADKAHVQMIQAFKLISRQLPGWKLILAGSVDPHQDFYLSKLARLGAGYEIDIMPNLSAGYVASLFSRASIYWHATGVSLPSTASAQEHMGITPLEAQASGCVPIVYNSGGMPEVVIANKTGLLFDNVMDLPHKTVSLLNDMDSWAQMSQAGQMWSKSWSDFEAFVGRVDDMLNDRSITPLRPFAMNIKYGPPDVTAVIPTYNSPLLKKCLASLKETVPGMKILVINNGDPIEPIEGVTIHDSGENLGFAGAHRLASTMVDTPLVLMLNDDIEATRRGWLEYLLFIMNSDKVGVVGPKLYFPDGRLQFAGGIIDWNREDIGYHKNYGAADSIFDSTSSESDFITGAALLCRKDLYEIPDYLIDLLNMEDVEICFNARKNGYQVVYQPASSLIHHEGETKNRILSSEDKMRKARKLFGERWGNAVT